MKDGLSTMRGWAMDVTAAGMFIVQVAGNRSV